MSIVGQWLKSSLSYNTNYLDIRLLCYFLHTIYRMANIPGLKNVCTPAAVYFVLSMATIFAMVLQNLGNPNSYCIGRYTCNVTDVNMLFVIKFVYVVFWTWLLNIICREGFEGISWVLVILPYILMFIFILAMFIPK